MQIYNISTRFALFSPTSRVRAAGAVSTPEPAHDSFQSPAHDPDFDRAMQDSYLFASGSRIVARVLEALEQTADL